MLALLPVGPRMDRETINPDANPRSTTFGWRTINFNYLNYTYLPSCLLLRLFIHLLTTVYTCNFRTLWESAFGPGQRTRERLRSSRTGIWLSRMLGCRHCQKTSPLWSALVVGVVIVQHTIYCAGLRSLMSGARKLIWRLKLHWQFDNAIFLTNNFLM